MARLDRLQELLLGAGFVSREIENLDCHWRFIDFDEYWAFLMELAGAVSVFLVGLSSAQRDVVRQAIQEAAEPFRTKSGYDFPGRTINVSAS